MSNATFSSIGIEAITRERARQIDVEGRTAEDDDNHRDCSLALVAALYASPMQLYCSEVTRDDSACPVYFGFEDPWPTSWDDAWDGRDRHGYRRRLEIAGALIAAEIDRLDRAEKGSIA